MYQKCPVCNGTGISYQTKTINEPNYCHVCKGHGIISKLNGKIPAFFDDSKYKKNTGSRRVFGKIKEA